MGKPNQSKTSTRTRRRLQHLLKQNGPSDATALAAELGLSAMAVRQHLYALQAEQLVGYQEQARPVGRPAKLWSLTAAADALFPDAHAELTVGLIESLTTAFGPGGMDKLLRERARTQIEAYRRRLGDAADLKNRLAELVAIRTREGYMAALEESGDNGTGGEAGYLLVENHCPICAAATACQGLCAMELEVFQAVLGNDVRVERTDHILAGARRCAYRVSPHRRG